MVSTADLRSRCGGGGFEDRFPRWCYYYTPPPSSASVCRSFGGRSMRTFRSNMFQAERKYCEVPENSIPEEVNVAGGEVADGVVSNAKCVSDSEIGDAVDISGPVSDFSACSSDISGELQRLSALPDPGSSPGASSMSETESSSGVLQIERFSTEIIESMSPENLQSTVKLCVDALCSSSIALKRSAAAKLRFLAKNRTDNRALIGESGAVPALIPLLRCSDPTTQEHSVTALLNLSLHESNKTLIIDAGAVKSLIYVLKTGTETSKQNAACGLLSLASTDKNKLSIGASGAIPPLVTLLKNGSNRSKKDALTTLYKLCSVKINKERAIAAGAVKPLLVLAAETDTGLPEKAMVVLSSLSWIEMGKEAVVEANGIAVLVEAIQSVSDKVKGFAALTLQQLCEESVANRELVVKEGGIPPLMLLSQSGTGKAKQKASILLEYLTESTMGASSSTS
ncbi:U-box domain-containing protein 4-like [Andrographis paniculata]|uniref:U-box domain-containing protein 4-like n=1 Tax=Andrographis paniculata TaxID=175694 RepID=UPI0021E89176|nr:U-box domain-containing protein 4-like [Andrographis paniculata]